MSFTSLVYGAFGPLELLNTRHVVCDGHLRLMLPGAVTLIPTFMMWNKLGFVNSFVPLIAQLFGGGGFNVF